VHWKPFEFEGAVYDLSHLDRRTCHYKQPAQGDKPERAYEVDVLFSLHCFTRGFKPGERPDRNLQYSDKSETRVFDFRRYELSKRLPAIFDTLAQRKCYHTDRNNFLAVEGVDDKGNVVEYEIFFVASRSPRKGVVTLFVQSAYIRDKKHLAGKPRRKSIGLPVILFNILHGKPIKPPQ
jgi:hypothetical protein